MLLGERPAFISNRPYTSQQALCHTAALDEFCGSTLLHYAPFCHTLEVASAPTGTRPRLFSDCSFEPTFLHATFAERPLSPSIEPYWLSGLRCQDSAGAVQSVGNGDSWVDTLGPPAALPHASSTSFCVVEATEAPHCSESPQNFGYHFKVGAGETRCLQSDNEHNRSLTSLPSSLLSSFASIEDHFKHYLQISPKPEL